MENRILNITNGDAFNRYFLSEFGGSAVPFCEAMMDGRTVFDIYSAEYINLRSAELEVDVELYKSKMQVYNAMLQNDYDKLCLWFGKDTFCQMNLLTLLAYLEQVGYGGEIILNYVDDETFEIVERNINVELGKYKKLYEKILIYKKIPSEVGILIPSAIELYFDYHSSSGSLAKMVRENSDREDNYLVCLLLENSKEYGLSDIQAEKLIKKHRKGVKND